MEGHEIRDCDKDLTAKNLRSRNEEYGRTESERKDSGSPPRSERSRRSEGTNATTTSVMLDVKNARKRAEGDLQLLANRLALLRAEEQKALQKMNETKSRASEILEIKKRNEEMLNEKISYHVNKERATKEVRERAEKDRHERKDKIARNKDILLEAKRIEAIETKEEARKFMEYQMREKIAMEEEKRRKAAEEKRRRDQLRQLRDREKAEKEELAQQQYARKIAEEAERTEQTERMIEQMEREERELIERLKRTQEMQKEAYEVLQKSLDI